LKALLTTVIAALMLSPMLAEKLYESDSPIAPILADTVCPDVMAVSKIRDSSDSMRP
jgi:hypothetical protein